MILATAVQYPCCQYYLKFWKKKTVANQLTKYLENYKLLSNIQRGFRAHLSTSTALTAVTDKLYYNIDNKHISILTHCDLSEAFDGVHHTTLFTKLSKTKTDTFWFEDYLFNRTQTVRLHSHLSSQLHLEYGIPQGSILGPILFTVYVNDMQEHFNDCTLIQYGDNTQFLHSAPLQDLHTLVKNVETTQSRAVSYFSKNYLMLNSQKTQCMFIGSRQLL